MIRVTIELLPKGDESKAMHLGTAYIANDATGDSETGNYHISLSKWGKPGEIWKQGGLRGFKRLEFGPWDLLCLCLIATLGNRIKKALK